MRRSALSSVLLLVAAAGCHKQEPKAPQPAPTADAAPGVADATAKVDRSSAGKAMPATAFTDMAGTPVKLTDFKGKPVLLNLWATWCVPCVRELPQLDALAGQGLTVIAVSQDLDGAAKVTPFVAQRNFKTLKPYLDKSNALMLGLKEQELPASILYGADGKEIWRVRGGMDWTGPDAKKLLAEAGA